jgi:hypothetical protein
MNVEASLLDGCELGVVAVVILSWSSNDFNYDTEGG